jgi:hypothetical protein
VAADSGVRTLVGMSARHVSVREAKTHLSKLLVRVTAGETGVVTVDW